MKQRWPGSDLELQLVDVEIKRHPVNRELSEVPALFWHVGDRNYRCAFSPRYQQYDTGKNAFDDIAHCLVMLLQVHTDKETMKHEEIDQE